ncbi:alpha/beta hydrolase [Labrys monachus]|uniref:Acetyl esterase n=1 Tax=Labrys monachus TaxID=217067 RepID=A0ABU0FMT3_9HYPH|nr:alpha/beta hydrolase [Labrys monachus]MDQ0395914.1 acetyl esterase [Labrys monachus]
MPSAPALAARLAHLAEARPPLDPGMAAFRARLAAETPHEAIHWPLDRQRSAWDAVCRSYHAPHPPGLAVTDLAIAGPGGPLKLRLYRPEGGAPKPGLLYFHGGGWVLGSLETHDDMCAEIAAGADVAVVALDYRLAPEHPFPAQLEDSHALLAWVLAEGAGHGIDTARLVAGGDSAGGQMTAALAGDLRDRGEDVLRGQILIYPVLGAETDTASYRRNATDSALAREEMVHYLDAFLGPPTSPAWRDKRAVPLLENDFDGLPPAFITAAAHDVLQDEAFFYAARLEEAGVPVSLRHEPALDHSYMRARHHSTAAAAGFAAIVAAARSLGHHGRLPA